MSSGSLRARGLSEKTRLTDLEHAWSARLDEAQTLEENGHHAMALALRVYAVEIKLKAIICKHLSVDCLPAVCMTHDLEKLIIFSGLVSRLDDASNLFLRKNWDEVASFSSLRLNDARYLPPDHLSRAEIDGYRSALLDPTHGVWPWLSTRL